MQPLDRLAHIARRGLAAVVLALAPLLAPADAARPRPITLRFPRFEVPPDSDREVCTFVRVPMETGYDLAGQAIASVGVRPSAGNTSHHFLIWAYTGDDLDGFAAAEGKIVDSTGCLDLAPDASRRLLLGGIQTPRGRGRYPRGLALRMEPVPGPSGPAMGFIMNSHWINGSTKPVRGAVKVKLLPARPGTVKKYVRPIFEVVANAFIDVPPGEVGTAGWRWAPGTEDLSGGLGGVSMPAGDACVLSLTGHMHQWGRLFTADLVDAGGGRTPLLSFARYDHPPFRQFVPGRLVRVGERIEYACLHDNGVERTAKLGCEEEPGVAPGRSILASLGAGDGIGGAPAKRCSQAGPSPDECPPSDPAHPGRSFTGACVPARLVFGFTSHDEMCILPGTYYDADPSAAPGHECDVR
jgi:hypothetical protein